MAWRSSRPPARIRAAARRALKVRSEQPKSRQAGTPVGLETARQLAAGERLTGRRVLKAYSFLKRHQKSPGSAEKRQDKTSKASQAVGFWGGLGAIGWFSSQRDSFLKYRDGE